MRMVASDLFSRLVRPAASERACENSSGPDMARIIALPFIAAQPPHSVLSVPAQVNRDCDRLAFTVAEAEE